ncbi:MULTISPECIES: hypothetical protein [unclassified Streptomyces]|uniref:hypothetical protein n=1 Tax=unclassified Streptomyces TaxID=2593676 RepID=UPI0036E46D48
MNRVAAPLLAGSLDVAQALADVTTISLLLQRTAQRGNVLNEQLLTALNSRVLIEQAKGNPPNARTSTWNGRSPCCVVTPAAFIDDSEPCPGLGS